LKKGIFRKIRIVAVEKYAATIEQTDAAGIKLQQIEIGFVR
jgi:hypothetical protein